MAGMLRRAVEGVNGLAVCLEDPVRVHRAASIDETQIRHRTPPAAAAPLAVRSRDFR
jgi:hypothetical protein